MRELDAAAVALSSDLAMIAERRADAPGPAAQPQKLSAKIYAIMAVTTMLTFAALTTGYQILFPPHQLFA